MSTGAMEFIVLVSVLLSFMVVLIECQPPPPPPAKHKMVGQNSGFHDKAHIQDKEHMKEHYDGVISQDNTQQLSDEELNFHYFKVHDYDNNNKLDGIELISALTHYHKDDSPNAPRLPDTELTSMIDAIMLEDDLNNDGLVDYPEFIMSQNRVRND